MGDKLVMEKCNTRYNEHREIKCQAYEEEFSYCAKYDEVCGVAIAPGIGIPLYSKSGSDYFPITELADY